MKRLDSRIDRRTLFAAAGATLAGAGYVRFQTALDALKPAPPPSQMLSKAAADALRDAGAHFFDAANKRFRPTNGGAPPAKNGLIDYSPDTPFPAFWQMEELHNSYVNDWLVTGNPVSRRIIEEQWTYIKSVPQFTTAVLAGRDMLGVTVNIYDDACWQAMYLMQVHQVTGDLFALALLAETIANANRIFADGSASNPVIAHGTSPNLPNIDYGNGTYPAADGSTRFVGAPIRSNAYGALYARPGTSSYASFGSISTVFEAMMAICALYVADRLSDETYASYAVNTYDWIFAKLRTPVRADATRKIDGLYETELILDPNGSAKDPSATYLTPQFGYFGKPIRGLDSTYLGGALAMAVLASRLWRRTSQNAYLAEALHITGAIVDLRGYGRIVNGKTLIQNTRDPWTEGQWALDFAREVLTLKGVSATARQAFIDTAGYIATNLRVDGYIAGDWAGPELNPNDGTRTWLAAYTRSPGQQGSPQQIMTTATSISMLQAGAVLERDNRMRLK